MTVGIFIQKTARRRRELSIRTDTVPKSSNRKFDR
ncbi:hypothetical protein JMJ77_0010435 [Colletotrichum scovillei]|uniref:Uncharacterized protein n=1 Tax=Colletotrichum scovillei TaxID=1209932 RepID=A0A9P7QSW6_9PEZI|nr:hypothetical protein JMJ78_0011805 [Colletotrichum scovillei]KAG7042335.1 hypothetical protein JMJ77_0010435 [Colletotrichum scovillei]KAG7062369.1 hypothetical protein JMJ76_0006644 [Colletotrichum scovillei]